MHGVQALLRDDTSCALGGKESVATAWAPPHCGGGALLGGPQYAPLALAWNATLQHPNDGVSASPGWAMGAGHAHGGAELSCTLNL